MPAHFFTASVTFQFVAADGSIEVKTIHQDVTDEIAEGADPENLVDRIFWKEIDGKFNGVEILGGGVNKEPK